MKESCFVNEFLQHAEKVLDNNFIIKNKANLLYELYLDQNLEVKVKYNKDHKRGNSAFQTDICIFEKIRNIEFPSVLIEFKTNISTHDILTYLSKAGKHKLIYPALR